ncbi:MAG TPA: hypothetical protein PKA60_00575 [Candidatus Paceibacterota bacterium]|nr:hypothetical protein [Candidatus Paceibacterota bacterium]
MDELLAKEKVLYESLINKTRDRDFFIALHSYMEYILVDCLDIVVEHLSESYAERKDEIEEIENIQKEILDNATKLLSEIEKLIKKHKLQGNEVLQDEVSYTKKFLSGEVKIIQGNFLNSLYDSCEDILNRLISLGFEKEIGKCAKISRDSRISDINALEKRKVLSLKESAFIKRDARRPSGALTRLMEMYQEIVKQESADVKTEEININNFMNIHMSNARDKEYEGLMTGKIASGTYYSKEKYLSDLEIIHNAITLNKVVKVKEDTTDRIFYMKDNNIYHHKNGLMHYDLNGLEEPKYIEAFKNVIIYMHDQKNKIRISELEKYMSKEERTRINYRSNLGNTAKPFNNFLKKNGVKNIHPKTKTPILAVTDRYITFNNKI